MARRGRVWKAAIAMAVAIAGVTATQGAALAGSVASTSAAHRSAKAGRRFSPAITSHTDTPIKHLVVIFQENVSFDHYFGTYPDAANPAGEPRFKAAADTPSVNGLNGPLLTNNPNLSNPQRLDRSQAVTCDQDHDYTAEQSAFDHGLMDKFVQNTGGGLTLQQCLGSGPATPNNYAVMDYYDGNTVTGLWNYAQHFALSDNSFGDNFGPSTPGAVNVVSGDTYGARCGPSSAVYNGAPCTTAPGSSPATPGSPQSQGSGTTYSDADPNFDICSATQDGDSAADTIQMGGQNIGDLLNQEGVTWGWFQGGFASPGYVPGKPSTDDLSKVCTGSHKNIAGATVADYSPHHEPFQYYASTANPTHLPPTSIASIGSQDQANHQYDLRDFFAAADNGNLPAVSFLKASRYQDGHAGYSDPLDEQSFITSTINNLQRLPTWSSTAVVIAYDDSDGWYDHQIGPIISQSQTSLDTLTDPSMCGSDPANVPTNGSGTAEQARCGVGPRLPLLVISPYAKRNYVDNTETTQSSVLKFIEDNWLGGQRLGLGSDDAATGSLDNMFQFTGDRREPELILSPQTGEPIHSRPAHGGRH
jgi:phospholipase C